MSAAVETFGLCKAFKGFKAVDGLDLIVPEGSIYGFLGPNGAGKTTTLKMLVGLTRPTSGSMRICGQEVIFGSLGNRKDIGFLPDVPNFYNWMSPTQFLKFTGELFSIEKGLLNARVEELLDLVGLGGGRHDISCSSRRPCSLQETGAIIIGIINLDILSGRKPHDTAIRNYLYKYGFSFLYHRSLEREITA
jgi:ABC-2 type transport system ATP-binding protein